MVSSLLPRHGGYRGLKTFRLAQLIYDVTVRFCDCYVDRRSRTHDQMTQAARSGVQNIAEASQVSATSKKFEIKLTSVARGSLEELRLDFLDFLRQRGLPVWPPDHPALKRFRALRCASVDEVRDWIRSEQARMARDTDKSKNTDAHGHTRTNTDESENTDEHGRTRTNTDRKQNTEEENDTNGQCASRSHASPAASTDRVPSSAVFAANAGLSLINVCCYLLDRQIEALAEEFEEEGGFTERLYHVRRTRRKRKPTDLDSGKG
jgi:four helix bundle suffix protein